MAKAKKEFKARVRKIRKHLDVLRSIQEETFGEDARRSMDVTDILNSIDDSTKYLENVLEGKGPYLHEQPEGERKDPRSIAN